MAHHQRRQHAALDLAQAGVHPHVLFGEGLAARKCEVGFSRGEGVEALRIFRPDLSEAAVRPVARVGLHQPRVLLWLQAKSARDDVGGFTRAQQRAAPQDAEAVCARALGQLRRLCSSRVVERHLLLALEATLEVVCRLAVTGEEDAVRGRLAIGSDDRWGC